ncbi:MAG: efflux RND transporter permease subunit [Bacteroidales bacterium]
MVDFLIRRPIATLMSFIAIVVLGIIASGRLPISLLPDINIPEITVHISHKNASLHELESSVVTPVRRQLLQLTGLNDIQSETRNGESIIRLRFNFDIDVDYAFIEVNDKVDAVMANMPREVQRPRIIKASSTDIPVFYINVAFKNDVQNDRSFLELSDFVNNVVKKRIEQLPEVALVDITGLVLPEIYILPYEDKFRSLGLTLSDLQTAFTENNLNPGSITVRDGHYQYNLMFSNELRSINDIADIYIKNDDRIFRLGDIAEVGQRKQESKGVFLNGGKESINLAIIKHSSAKMNILKSQVEKTLSNFIAEYPELDFEISQDQTILLNLSLDNLKQSLYLGCILAVLILFLFIRNPRAPLLIAFNIPVSIVISMLAIHMFGISINIISLSGMILGVGMMIDNSIIVIDNIAQYLARGQTLNDAIIKGTNDVVRPMISSVLTTCAVFVPLIFISGISGALFYDQAITVSICLFISLFVSITLIPVLYKLFNVNNTIKKQINFLFFDIEKHYNVWFDWAFRNRRAVLLFFLSFVIAGFILFFKLEKRQMPKISENELVVSIDWGENIRLETSTYRIQELLKNCSAIDQSNSYLGTQQFLLNKSINQDINEASIYIKTCCPEKIVSIIDYFKNTIQGKYPEAEIKFSPPKNIFQNVFSGSNDAVFVAEVSSAKGSAIPSQTQIEKLFKAIKKQNSNVVIPDIPKQQYIRISVEPKKLLLYQVDKSELITELRDAFNQNQIGQIIDQNSFIPVVTGQKEKAITSILENTYIRNKKGIKYPLLNLIKVEKQEDYKSIISNETGPFIPIIVNAINDSLPKLYQTIGAFAPNYPDLSIRFSGSWFDNKVLVREMSLVLLISLLLLYFILAAQFESLIQPFIVLIEIPIDVGGAFIVLYLFNSSINIMSMIGIIVLSGVVINDSILKIDTINKLRDEGYSIYDAIHIGGTRRLKPILMTSMTTILALLPVLFGSNLGSELQFPLALTIIAGLVLGTAVSLFFIPIIYFYIYRKYN